MENPNTPNPKPTALSTRLERPSLATIKIELTRLALLRRAELSREELDLFATELVNWATVDLQAGLKSLLRPRRDGETAFPSLGDINLACEIARNERYKAEDALQVKRRELEQEAHRQEHPELYISAKEFWTDPKTQELLGRSVM